MQIFGKLLLIYETMKIIIPMSGKGSRFVNAGYKTPKPLLLIDGKKVIDYIITMFPGENDFLFICNEDHIKNTDMLKALKNLLPECSVKIIPAHEKGPVFSVTQVLNEISDKEQVFISYCDYGQYWDYEKFKNDISRLDPDGAIPSYTGFHPHLLNKNLYAGILADSSGMMTDIREKHCFTKNPEDSFHSGGSYYFKSGSIMKKYFRELMEKNINLNGEYYVSMAYYLLKRDGLRVFIPKIEHFLQFGTPEDVEQYEAWSQLIHSDFQKKKSFTEIPSSRSNLVKIPYPPDSEDYKKSYQYWKEYFIKKW